MSESAASSVAGHELLIVTGKGGVGKTTVAAAFAANQARRGRRVLLVEVDARENAHRMLDVPPSGGEAVAARPGLWLQNLRPRAVLDRVVREQVRFGPVASRILGSEVYRHFVEGAPGLEELAILGHALRVLQGVDSVTGRKRGVPTPEVDLVVLDAPATGHGLALLRAPGLVAASIRSGPFGALAAGLAERVEDPERCGVVVACAAEEMPTQEAIELIERLRTEHRREPVAVVVNGLYPPRPRGSRRRADPLGDLWRQRRAVNERELARLHAVWRGATVELPLLPLEAGPPLLEALAARIARPGAGA